MGSILYQSDGEIQGQRACVIYGISDGNTTEKREVLLFSFGHT